MTRMPQHRPQRMHADEVDVDDALVRRILAEQFAKFRDLPLQRAPSTGTDNAIYRLGDRLGLRLPRIDWAVPQIAREHEWLPRLAPHLPAPVPEPVAVGEPSGDYPYPWLVYRWLDGCDALAQPVADWCRLADDVAAFVHELQRVEQAGAPTAGARGGPLEPHDESTRRAIAGLGGLVDTDALLSLWADAVAAEPWPGPGLWVHADLLPGNVLIRDSHLAGIIDWGAAGIGDPACEAMLAWAMPTEARARFRTALDIDDATWARGRGWAINQAAHFIPYYETTIPDGVAAAKARLEAVVADG